MDHLHEIIQSISKENQKRFLDFLDRNQKKAHSKLKELFILIAFENISDGKKLQQSIYPTRNDSGAYHACRIRLYDELISFIAQLQHQEDESAEMEIEKVFQASKYLFSKRNEVLAWKYLREAENLAIHHEAFQFLNRIYSYQIEKSNIQGATPIKEILAKKENAMKLASDQDNATIAYQVIKFRLNQSLEDGTPLNLQKEVSHVLDTLEVSNSIQTHPKILINLISIVRTAAMIRKDFFHLEPFLKHYIEIITSQSSFQKQHINLKVQLYYYYLHTLYRNKRFTLAEEILKELESSITNFTSLELFPKLMLLKAAVYNYSGRNQLAIATLTSLLEMPQVKNDKISLYNGYLNLSTYYFQNKQYHSSLKVFREIPHSDKWLAEIMGREWILKKHLTECINQLEIGNHDLVEIRIKQIQKNFQDLFGHDIYRRIQTFVYFMKKINQNPLIASTKEFKNEVKNSFEYTTSEKEDIQAMTFYAWLKGRMQQQDYYQVLMEMLQAT